MKFMIYKVPYC